MDTSPAVVGSDVFDTYDSVIDFFVVRMLISLAFGNGWEITSNKIPGYLHGSLQMPFQKN